MNIERMKERAAEHAVETLTDEHIIGLGSGSTAAYAIKHLGEKIETENLDVIGVPTSEQTRELAQQVGIPTQPLEETPQIDVVIDGADQVVNDTVVKGGGGAHSREKAVAERSEHVHIIVDETKLAHEITHTIPVEITPETKNQTQTELSKLATNSTLRTTADGTPMTTDSGGFIVDCDFETIQAPETISNQLNAVPGVIEHGLCLNFTDTLTVGLDGGVVTSRTF